MRIAHGVNVDEDQKYDPSKEARASKFFLIQTSMMLAGIVAILKRASMICFLAKELLGGGLAQLSQYRRLQSLLNQLKNHLQSTSRKPQLKRHQKLHLSYVSVFSKSAKKRDGESLIGLESQ